MNKPLAFVKRNLLIEVSYRFSFVFQVGSVLLSITSYYFLARFLGSALVPGLNAYGGDYFAFVLIGVALHDYLATSLDAFSRSIRESQLAGTLEALDRLIRERATFNWHGGLIQALVRHRQARSFLLGALFSCSPQLMKRKDQVVAELSSVNTSLGEMNREASTG